MFSKQKILLKRPLEMVARLFQNMGFTPNGLTLLGVVLVWGVCFFYVWNRNAILFSFLVLCCGLFDLLDGVLARMTGNVSKFGSYLDAICDRLFEAGPVLAVAWVTGYWALCFVFIVGAMMTSYAKARAAMEVKVVNDEWPDLMERFERSAIFLVGLVIWGLFPGVQFFNHDLIFWILGVLSIGIYTSLVQRVLRAKRIIEKRA